MVVFLIFLIVVFISPAVPGTQAQNEGDLRLVGGEEESSGRLEIYLRGQWGTVCDSSNSFRQTEANVACRQLGFFSATGYGNAVLFGFDSASSSTPIWLDGVNCYPTDSTLLSCDHNDIGSYNCDHGDVEGLRCTNEPENWDLRLVDSSSTNVEGGRLEVYYRGEWGTVCDSTNSFGQAEADLVCRILGFSSASRYGYVDKLGYESTSTMRIWFDEVECPVRVPNFVASCRMSIIHDCVHSQDVAVDCGPASSSAGIVAGIAVMATFIFVFCVCLAMCVVCVYIHKREKRHWFQAHTHNYPSSSSPSTSAVSTATTSALPQAAAYPASNSYTPTQAQQLPPTHSLQEKDHPLPHATLQEAPPPSYSEAAAYPPPSYPMKSSPGPYSQQSEKNPNLHHQQDQQAAVVYDPLPSAPYPVEGNGASPYPD